MFAAQRGYVLALNGAPAKERRLEQLDIVGYKACGLALIPREWTPPFLVLSADLYRQWRIADDAEQERLLRQASSDLEYCIASWTHKWPHGLAFRSSATSETLQDRGAYQSVELTADFSSNAIKAAIADIFKSFSALQSEGAIAVVVQARLHLVARGHLSNERRISKTVNQWMWEQEDPSPESGRTNSQRAVAPAAQERIPLQSGHDQVVIHALQRVGRWSTELGLGPVHLEWGIAGVYLWLFQLDMEDDQPDPGLDPALFLRATDATPAGAPPSGSPFQIAQLDRKSGWPKIDKVRDLKEGRATPYPQLCFASGADIETAFAEGRDLVADVLAITNNHAVCRTDCISPSIEKLNLPRTETVSAKEVVNFLKETLADLKARGAKAGEICFILHKFIPSRAAACALAAPDRQIVLVDALWGLPDGLQYLTHDRFEFDVKLGELSTEVTRYKPYFLQETEGGAWKRMPVKRRLARHRAISLADIREVAEHTHRVASALGKPVQIMWFCDVDPKAGAGRNIPWFMQSAEMQEGASTQTIPEASERITISTIEQLQIGSFSDCVLELEPEAELFRDEEFLRAVAAVALQGNLPVVIRGSTLSHAFYTLHRKGVFVVATESSRTRTRQRQVFRKLVRDDIPARIVEKGERVSVARIAQSQSRAALVIKLHEEAQELLQATKPDEVTAELADLLEVVRSLCLATGTDIAAVEAAAEKKRAARGSFERNVVLIETSRAAWNEKPVGGQESTIDLAKLAYVETHGTNHLANFTSVLGGHEAAIELSNGTVLKIKITQKGIEVSEGSPDNSASDQLSFKF